MDLIEEELVNLLWEVWDSFQQSLYEDLEVYDLILAIPSHRYPPPDAEVHLSPAVDSLPTKVIRIVTKEQKVYDLLLRNSSTPQVTPQSIPQATPQSTSVQQSPDAEVPLPRVVSSSIEPISSLEEQELDLLLSNSSTPVQQTPDAEVPLPRVVWSSAEPISSLEEEPQDFDSLLSNSLTPNQQSLDAEVPLPRVVWSSADPTSSLVEEPETDSLTWWYSPSRNNSSSTAESLSAQALSTSSESTIDVVNGSPVKRESSTTPDKVGSKLFRSVQTQTEEKTFTSVSVQVKPKCYMKSCQTLQAAKYRALKINTETIRIKKEPGVGRTIKKELDIGIQIKTEANVGKPIQLDAGARKKLESSKKLLLAAAKKFTWPAQIIRVRSSAFDKHLQVLQEPEQGLSNRRAASKRGVSGSIAKAPSTSFCNKSVSTDFSNEPSTSIEGVSSYNFRDIPSTSFRDIPSTSFRDIPSTSFRDIPSTSSRDTQSTSFGGEPSTVNFELKPLSTRFHDKPSTSFQNTPLTRFRVKQTSKIEKARRNLMEAMEQLELPPVNPEPAPAKDGKTSPVATANGASSNDTTTKTRQDVFQFVIPPEAPVFHPTESEFANPLVYIDKIRPTAEKFGICKIKPPANWQPPFAVDVDKLKFTPRIQRLNELEAKTRIKLNFLDQIAKFWELQGSSLKIPMVEKRALDLYTLHRLVENEGGFTGVTRERKWAKVAVFMGYPQGKGIGTILKTHYERLLYPFELFTNEKKAENKNDGEPDSEYKPTKSTFLAQMNGMGKKNGYSRRSKAKERFISALSSPIKTEPSDPNVDAEAENEHNKELKRLQFYGAGPKMAGYNNAIKKKMEEKGTGKLADYYELDPLAKYVCHNCRRGDSEEQMLLCDGCDDSYHTFCLMPPLVEIPKGDWCCPKCVAAEVSKPTEAFGFEQAQREYNLQQFGEMADTFKSEYFNMPVHMVPTSMVEKEFWRIVSSIDEDVTVEYGADLHTMDHGSGFPTKNSLNLLPGDQEYAYSGWNLNNLPVLEGSVLGYINADISGMKVPWMYVGMCFATFCWHNEDHWSYSINYLHWGEPKTWYGVSGMKAELFEATMKSAAPELFQSQPDLLHQLVTIMNPNILMNAGVPVYRTDQHAGEFVITFPRAYHAGFNQGYNFAEAVNFAPADWVAMGRECVLHYSQLRRFCVFSHDELVCKMATNSKKLDITVAAATYTDMLRMVETEKKLRKSLLDWGVTSAEREAFELLPDDERQCEICKTTCFMSALTCSCSTEMLVCLRHYTSLCECPPSKHTLRYRYTLDELLPLLRSLKQKAESFDRWADRVKEVLDRKSPKTVDLGELKSLLSEADGKNFPKSDLLLTLANAIEDAEKCASVIRQLDLNKVRTRHSFDSKSKLSLEELRLFCEEIDSLACVLDEQKIIKDLLDKTNHFEDESRRLLDFPLKECPIKVVETLIEFSNGLFIDLPSLKTLKLRHNQLRWINDVYETRNKSPDIADIDTLKELLRKGFTLPGDPMIESILSSVQSVITQAEDWEERAQALFKRSGPDVITEAEELIKSAGNIDVYLPTENLLVDSVNNVNEWFKQLEKINSLEFYPYLTAIEELVKKCRQFPFHLDEMERLKTYIASANAWKDKTSKTFLKRNTCTTLMEALSPRTQMSPTKGRKRNTEDCIKLVDNMDPAAVVAIFKDAEDKEMKLIQTLREVNVTKILKIESDNTFCICQKKAFGVMMQCDLCKDWFHSSCIQLPKLATSSLRKDVKSVAVHLGFKDCKYLCTNCHRTRRPRLETILGLLMSLQKLHSRLPEGEALQCLTERAMNWQDRARQLLQNPELSVAIAKATNMMQKYSEAAAKLKTEKIITTELRKAASNPELHKRVQEIAPLSGVTEDDVHSLQSFSSDEEDSKDEHAYSMNFSKLEDTECTVQLNVRTRELVEELVTEGDLLEVSIDESNQLFQLLLLSRDLEKEPVVVDFDSSQKLLSAKKGRKRRSDEMDMLGKRLRKDMLNSPSPRAKGLRKPKETIVREVTDGRKRKGRGRGGAQSLSDDEADEDATCAVSTCLQPTGDEVDWVQCDGGCEQWFHMACVGLSVKDINEDEDYICSACSPDTVKERLKLSQSNDIIDIIEF